MTNHAHRSAVLRGFIQTAKIVTGFVVLAIIGVAIAAACDGPTRNRVLATFNEGGA